MRLATIKQKNEIEVVASVVDGEWIGVTDVLHAMLGIGPAGTEDDMTALIRNGMEVLEHITELLQSQKYSKTISLDDVEWLPPVLAPSKIVCMALNNRALDAIKLRAPTDHPAFFLKTRNALVGHKQPIELRKVYGLTHPEPELAVVIGNKIKNADPESAMNAVFGYTIMNDITSVGMREEDTFAFRYFRPDPQGGKPIPDEGHSTYPGRYKASDSFAPVGPYIVTRNEIPDPNALDIQCWLGDELVANDNTRNYTWNVADALSHISQTMTLFPGDIVSMGTGVGGDKDDPNTPEVPGVTRANLIDYKGSVTITISELGTLINPVVMMDS